jgi:hypothetical protein
MKSIRVDIDLSVIEQQLAENIKNGDPVSGSKLANLIISGFHGVPNGYVTLFQAMNGFYPKPLYKVGQDIYVHKDGLSSWKFNIKEMEDQGMFIKGDYIKGSVTAFQPMQYNQYSVKLEAINSSGDKRVYETDVNAEQISSVLNDDVTPLPEL